MQVRNTGKRQKNGSKSPRFVSRFFASIPKSGLRPGRTDTILFRETTTQSTENLNTTPKSEVADLEGKGRAVPR